MKEQLRKLDKSLYNLSVRIVYIMIGITVLFIFTIILPMEEGKIMVLLLLGIVVIILFTVWLLKIIDLQRRVIGNIVEGEMTMEESLWRKFYF